MFDYSITFPDGQVTEQAYWTLFKGLLKSRGLCMK